MFAPAFNTMSAMQNLILTNATLSRKTSIYHCLTTQCKFIYSVIITIYSIHFLLKNCNLYARNKTNISVSIKPN